jgi:hypothetical protein
VAGFRAFPGQRGVLMEELLNTVLPNLPISRTRIPRAFVVGDSAATCIQMASALVLQLLQARISFLPFSACLPPLFPAFLSPSSSLLQGPRAMPEPLTRAQWTRMHA